MGCFKDVSGYSELVLGFCHRCFLGVLRVIKGVYSPWKWGVRKIDYMTNLFQIPISKSDIKSVLKVFYGC